MFENIKKVKIETSKIYILKIKYLKKRRKRKKDLYIFRISLDYVSVE